jgi:DNA polymerase-3 subunit alpha
VWVKGYLIHVKKTITSDGKLMFFGAFLDETGDWLDTIHFPKVAQKYPFRGRGVYRIFGTVTTEYNFILIEAEYMEKLAIIEDPRYTEIRSPKKETPFTSNNQMDHKT